MDNTTFGQRVYAQRLKQSLKQEALANDAEISPTTLKNIEADKISPRLDTALKIAKALGCPLSVLLGETCDMTELIALLRKLLAILEP